MENELNVLWRHVLIEKAPFWVVDKYGYRNLVKKHSKDKTIYIIVNGSYERGYTVKREYVTKVKD